MMGAGGLQSVTSSRLNAALLDIGCVRQLAVRNTKASDIGPERCDLPFERGDFGVPLPAIASAPGQVGRQLQQRSGERIRVSERHLRSG